jgi:hypothetical protein
MRQLDVSVADAVAPGARGIDAPDGHMREIVGFAQGRV